MVDTKSPKEKREMTRRWVLKYGSAAGASMASGLSPARLPSVFSLSGAQGGIVPANLTQHALRDLLWLTETAGAHFKLPVGNDFLDAEGTPPALENLDRLLTNIEFLPYAEDMLREHANLDLMDLFRESSLRSKLYDFYCRTERKRLAVSGSPPLREEIILENFKMSLSFMHGFLRDAMGKGVKHITVESLYNHLLSSVPRFFTAARVPDGFSIPENYYGRQELMFLRRLMPKGTPSPLRKAIEEAKPFIPRKENEEAEFDDSVESGQYRRLKRSLSFSTYGIPVWKVWHSASPQGIQANDWGVPEMSANVMEARRQADSGSFIIQTKGLSKEVLCLPQKTGVKK